MSEIFRNWLLTDGVCFEALETDNISGFGCIVSIQVERGHQVALRAFEIMEQGSEEVELALPIHEVKAL